MTVILSYQSKVTPIGALQAEEIAKAVLFYVFRIIFQASLFTYFNIASKDQPTGILHCSLSKEFMAQLPLGLTILNYLKDNIES